MGLGPTLLLGLIAGGTILLGLPIGRIRRPAPTLRALLNARGGRRPAVPGLGRAVRGVGADRRRARPAHHGHRRPGSARRRLRRAVRRSA